MDYVAVDFFLYQTSAAAPPADHTQAAAGGSFPQQQPPLLYSITMVPLLRFMLFLFIL
jgi:hypothetical protein